MKLVLPTLREDSFDFLVRGVLGICTPQHAGAAADLALADRLKMGLFEWVSHLGVLSEGQARYLLKEMTAGLAALAELLHDGQRPVFRLSIVEQQYALWPGLDEWLDLRYEERLKVLPVYPVTTYTCDVTALYLRMEAWLAKLRSQNGHQHHAPGEAAAGPGPAQEAPGG